MALALPVGGLRTVFPLVVVLAHMDGNRTGGNIEGRSPKGQAGDVLENVGVFDRFRRVLAPCEWGVAGHQDAWNGDGVQTFGAKSANDHRAGVADISVRHFLGSQRFCHRDRAVEVIGMCGAETGYRSAGLGPGSSEL